MTSTAWLTGLTVFFPIAAAAVCAVVPRIGALIACATSGVLVLVTVLLAITVANKGAVDVALGGWAEPVGIALRVDGLSAVFLVTSAIIGLLVSVYATGSAQAQGNQFFFALSLALAAGLNAVFVAADLFNTYVALELVTVAAVGAIALGGRVAIQAALRYLLVAVAGSLWFLLAVALLYAEAGSLSLHQIAQRSTAGTPVVAVAVAVATVGLALKSALVPMHAWLPPAHAGAPSAVSPLMSALVIKASLFVLFRLWTSLPMDSSLLAVSQVIGVLGCISVVWGSVQALRQNRLKRVIAYSTIAQVGYFVLLIPLVAPALVDGTSDYRVAELALGGVTAFVVGHALAKTAMFTAAGCLLYSYGTDELVALRGAAAAHPVPVFTFGLAGVALAGLPPALAFAGKWQLLLAALTGGQWWWLPVLLVGALLTAAYTVRVLAVMLATTDEPPVSGPAAPARMRYTALSAGIAAAVLGTGASVGIALSTVGWALGSP